MPKNIPGTIRDHSLAIALSPLFVVCGMGAAKPPEADNTSTGKYSD